MNKIELLAPAGAYESMVAAVENGASAVYLGGKNFSARAEAGNFSMEELENALDYCHLRHVKVYVTVNTWLKESEIGDGIEWVKKLSQMGVDAFIVQDYGVAKYIIDYLDTPVHASTQMTAHSISDVKQLKELGFSRVILARELSIAEIGSIIEAVPGIEVECFAHGSLCYAYSGQCYMSGSIGGRSGNRGRCAQPCRLPYTLLTGEMGNQSVMSSEKKYLLSPKDNMIIDYFADLYRIGCHSIKIEGRMKPPHYVAATVATYRAQLDYFSGLNNLEIDIDDVKEDLAQIFNRSGFTSYLDSYSGPHMMSVDSTTPRGVLLGKVVRQKGRQVDIELYKSVIPGDGLGIDLGREMVGTGISIAKNKGDILTVLMDKNLDSPISGGEKVYKTYDKKLIDFWNEKAVEKQYKRPVTEEVTIKTGKIASLTLRDSLLDIEVTVFGDEVEMAQKAPLLEEKVRERMLKTGDTPFAIENLSLHLSSNAFMPVGKMNELRRLGTDTLEKAILQSYKGDRKKAPPINKLASYPPIRNKKWTILVSNGEQLDAIIQNRDTLPIDRIYFETFAGQHTYINAKEACQEAKISFYAALPLINRFNNDLPEADGYLVRNLGDYVRCTATGKPVVLDDSFHVTNQLALNIFALGDTVTISSEISVFDMESFISNETEVIVYGHNVFMNTVQCPVGLYDGEKNKNRFCNLRRPKNKYFLEDRLHNHLPVVTNCEECYGKIYNDRPVYMLHRMEELESLSMEYVRLHFTVEDAAKVAEILEAAQNGAAPLGEFTYGHFFQSVL